MWLQCLRAGYRLYSIQVSAEPVAGTGVLFAVAVVETSTPVVEFLLGYTTSVPDKLDRYCPGIEH